MPLSFKERWQRFYQADQRAKKRRNDTFRVVATQHRQEWRADELAFVQRPGLTVAAKAALLGRTIYAVKTKRRELNRGR